MQRRSFALGLLAAPIGLASMSAVAQAKPDPGQDDDHQDDRRPYRRIPLSGSASDGRAFTGTLDIDSFTVAPDASGVDALWAVGTVSGALTGDGRRQPVPRTQVQVPASLATPMTAATASDQMAATAVSCPILNLTLGPLNLNLLGLVVNIPNPIVLNITAVPGAGNLLGNLLCAVANLLNGSQTLGQIAALLSAIVALLNG